MKKSLLGISLLTITCLYGLLGIIIIPITYMAGVDTIIGIYITIGIIVLQFLLAPFFTDLSMKWFYKAKFNEEIPEYLKTFITELCNKYNVKYPKIGIIHDGAPNAFTYGRTKKDARIVLTDGIFNLLNEEEIKTVVAHEIGHIVHYDMLFMTAVQIIPLVLYAIYEMFANSDVDDKDDAIVKVVFSVIAYILYIISEYIVLWLSRTREYYADSFSVDETKNPNGLAEALVKIGFGLSTAKKNGKHNPSKNSTLGISDVKESKAMAINCIENNTVCKDKIKSAMKWEMWNPWGKWAELNSTHPLISKRLLAISKRSKEFNQEPYIVFDLVKPESYVDDFLLELIVNFMPSILGIISIILYFCDKNLKVIATCLLFTVITSFIKFKRRHRNNYKETTVSELLSEVKVSNVTAIPCILKGEIIGRGNPGCIFNEDFVIKDETGIIFLDYNQPIHFVNKLFAIFKSEQYFGKTVMVKGWYRRNPVPYVEIYEYTVDSKTKKILTYGLSLSIYIILIILLFTLII